MSDTRGTAGGRPARRAEDQELPQLLDLAEVAERLRVTERHVRRLVNERRIPFLKWGHLLRFDPVELTAWLDEARVEHRTRRPGR